MAKKIKKATVRAESRKNSKGSGSAGAHTYTAKGLFIDRSPLAKPIDYVEWKGNHSPRWNPESPTRHAYEGLSSERRIVRVTVLPGTLTTVRQAILRPKAFHSARRLKYDTCYFFGTAKQQIRRKKRWTDVEWYIHIRLTDLGFKESEIAEFLERSIKSVRMKPVNMRRKKWVCPADISRKGAKWVPEEDEIAAQMRKRGVSLKVIAAALGRSYGSTTVHFCKGGKNETI